MIYPFWCILYPVIDVENKKPLIGLAVIIFIGIVLAWWSQSKPRIHEVKQEKILLDTYVSITAFDTDKSKAAKAIKEAFSEISKVDSKLNRYSPRSEISKINKVAAQKPVRVSEDTFKVLGLAEKYHKITAGAFDITVGPLVSLWDFNKKKVPKQSEITAKLKLVSFRNIKLDKNNRTVRLLKEKVVLDLGAVAKGYAADKAYQSLRKSGIKSALINTGSTTIILGKKETGPFRIGIVHPRKRDEIIGLLALKNQSLSTSGDYQQYFVKSGRRYNHIIDPKTGRPATSLMAVTIITNKSCAEADILSTAFFVLGKKKGYGLINKLKNTSAIAVTGKGNILNDQRAKTFIEELESKL